MSVGFLSCPFCGGEKIRDGYIRDGSRVYCADCSASVTAFHPNASRHATALWNCRPGEQEADALADKIEDLIAEFGDDPTAALQCVSEWLDLRRHASAGHPVGANLHD